MAIDTRGETVCVDARTRSSTEHKEATIKVYAKLVFEQTITGDMRAIQTDAALHNSDVPADSTEQEMLGLACVVHSVSIPALDRLAKGDVSKGSLSVA
jgi:hypothetical protein